MYWLIGGSGAPNYGDELIVKGWIEYLPKNLDVKYLRIESNNKESSESFHKAAIGEASKNGMEVSFEDLLHKISKNVEGLSFWDQFLRGVDFFRKGGVSLYGENNFEFLDSVTVIHLHGGGYLNNFSQKNAFILGFVLSLAKQNNIKLIATGIGLMPLSPPKGRARKELRDLFYLFSLFEVRDFQSYSFLRENIGESRSIVNGLDDLFVLENNSVFRKKPVQKNLKKRLIVSFVEHDLAELSDDYMEDLKKYGEQFDEVVFWECYPWQDRTVISFLKDIFPKLKVISAYDWVYKVPSFSVMDKLISSRFHPHFVAARAGISGVYNVKGDYYNVKHGSIVTLGSGFEKGNFKKFVEPIDCDGYLCILNKDLVSIKRKVFRSIFSVT